MEGVGYGMNSTGETDAERKSEVPCAIEFHG